MYPSTTSRTSSSAVARPLCAARSCSFFSVSEVKCTSIDFRVRKNSTWGKGMMSYKLPGLWPLGSLRFGNKTPGLTAVESQVSKSASPFDKLRAGSGAPPELYARRYRPPANAELQFGNGAIRSSMRHPDIGAVKGHTFDLTAHVKSPKQLAISCP